MKYPTGDSPSFAIVIPTYQRRERLQRVLAALALQRYPRSRLEVIVVSDGSTDGTIDMVRAMTFPFRLRLLEQQNQGPGAARNLGVREATNAQYILFLDDDVLAAPHLVAEHAAAHAALDNAVVIGPLLMSRREVSAWTEWESLKLAEQYASMRAHVFKPTPFQFFTGNASVRRDIVLAAGGFDPSFRRAEDVELGLRLDRLGLRFFFHEGAAASHIADRSFNSWLSAALDYGRNDVLIARAARDRGGMLERIVELNYHNRHPLTRLAVRLDIGYGAPSQLLAGGLELMLLSLNRIGLRRSAHSLCSAAFAIQYWRGVATEVGGRDVARTLIIKHAPKAQLRQALFGPGPTNHVQVDTGEV